MPFGQWVLHKPHLILLTLMAKEIPEVIVVGIAYPYSSVLDLWHEEIVFRDMLPTHVDSL